MVTLILNDEHSELAAFRGGSQRAVCVIFDKQPSGILPQFSPFWQEHPFDFSDVLHNEYYSCIQTWFILILWILVSSENVISYFWRSVYFKIKTIKTALRGQKEASDKSPKSQKVMSLDWTKHILLPFRVWSRNTHPAERYLSQDIMPLHWCHCTWQTHVLLIYEKFHFQELLPFVRVRQKSCHTVTPWRKVVT